MINIPSIQFHTFIISAYISSSLHRKCEAQVHVNTLSRRMITIENGITRFEYKYIEFIIVIFKKRSKLQNQFDTCM